MIASEIGSTNTEPVHIRITSEKAPLINGRSVLQRLSNIFKIGRTAHSQADGYVEFSNLGVDNTRTLGTFAGVFSPVTLSMFSALVFIRMGYIVGNAGLFVTLVQFIIAYGILLFTVASVCAISTNGAVEGGGAYFMISRTLGPEFGGSIGTLFFMANVVSSALCISGCAEGLVENFGPSGYLSGKAGLIPDGRWWRFLYCSILNTANLIVCLIGAAMFAKTSVMILAVVCVCLSSVFISFLTQGAMEIPIPDANTLVQNITEHVNGSYTGLLSSTLSSNLYSNYSADYSSEGIMTDFASVFGVLFSGVTGIMAGANMSGELKNPGRNIPRGTLSAVLFTFICYILLSILTAATTSRFLLQNNFMYMMPINIWPPFVAVGILTATFSAGLSNLIGSSRVLEALAKDNVFGSGLNFIIQGTWRGNPITAVLTSWVLVQTILLIGSLNTIAQINSVLFLLSYLATNLACLGLELASAPNFRPTFNYFTWHTATIGLLGTLIMMFIINSIYASSSIILCLILIIVLHLFSPSKNAPWGSISQALIFHQVRKYLLMLDSRKDHVKFWRPQMLLMVACPRSACPLIDFVNDLKKGGLYVIGHVKVGEFTGQSNDPTIEEYPHWLSLVDHMRVKAFVELTVTKTVREGMQHLIRLSGMGAMKPNTIVLGFYDEETPRNFFLDSQYATTMFENSTTLPNNTVFPLRQVTGEKNLDPIQYVGMCSDVLRMKKNLCLCRNFHLLNKAQLTKNSNLKYIDVWPVNFFQPTDQDPFDTTSLFMLQLACIINMVPSWKNLHLRVFHCETTDGSESLSISDSPNSMNEFPRISNEHRIRKSLNLLRISASIRKIPEWGEQIRGLKGRPLLEPKNQYESGTESNNALSNVSRAYILGVNQLIREHSSETATTFIYLPDPPVSNTWDEDDMYQQYLQSLTELTVDLPPTVLVHGVSTVTSTTL
ncbi:solute carrier family 12 member 9 [Pogonomyrmex barbatus]|uniref:Solute carrier family 12 member 9 n=1 Tax=Pogonomyrmex barbatus TaxID=144034 RepID=A0A6I9VZY2_9HYME|nr:solute carrier family 12 member 9 [Pogonomyrmex barbatus]XP_025073183.1 solute carrier family 12 member 9 [Pogonomyrmex barbatus]XP_025073186.1 solute carrier family 12 member 9 [Pogonomyrmex barbatus]